MPPRLPDSLKASLRALLTHLSLFRSNQTPSELVSLHKVTQSYTKLQKVTHNVTTHLRPRCKHTLYSDHILQLSRPRTARRPKPPGPDCYNSCIRRSSFSYFVTNPRFIHIDYSRINAISQSDVDHRSVVIDRSRMGTSSELP